MSYVMSIVTATEIGLTVFLRFVRSYYLGHTFKVGVEICRRSGGLHFAGWSHRRKASTIMFQTSEGYRTWLEGVAVDHLSSGLVHKMRYPSFNFAIPRPIFAMFSLLEQKNVCRIKLIRSAITPATSLSTEQHSSINQ